MEDRLGLGTGDVDADPNFNFINKILNSERNNEDDLLFLNHEFSPYAETNINCNYLDIDEISNIPNSNLSILSINIQSLPAKFLEISDLIHELSLLNNSPDIICLQETWQIFDTSLFQLQNYNLIEINSRVSARGGGVGIYTKSGIASVSLPQYSVFVERIFESLFIEITTEDKKRIVIGSVYRPGTRCPGITFTEQFAQFSEILSNTLSELSSVYDNVFIFGDFNLDALKIEENKYISDYIDTLFSYGFLQIITKPTRISENSATLIDHILTNSNNDRFDSYILCCRISDHFPILHSLNIKKSKHKHQKI